MTGDELVAAFPELLSDDRPTLRLCCRRGHRLLDVTLYRDLEGRLSLTSAGEDLQPRQWVAATADQGHPWESPSENEIYADRVRFDCHHRGCKCSSILGQDRLLALYADAVRHGRSEIHLPA